MIRPVSVAKLLVCVASLWLTGCGPATLTVLPGLINDPQNRSLRKGLLDFAVDRICVEARARSLPIKMRADDPASGRFFTNTCRVERREREQSLSVSIQGHGYAWTNVTGRVGFRAQTQAEYDHDFRIEDGRLFVYFRQRKTMASRFEPLVVTGPGQMLSSSVMVNTLAPVVRRAVKHLGERILKQQIERGVTVIRQPDGATQLSFGLVDRAQPPLLPFALQGDHGRVLFHDRSELQPEQRDYIGPIVVDDPQQQLHFDARVEGVSAVDVLLVNQSTGRDWLTAYEHQPQPTPPPVPALVTEVIPSTGPSTWKRIWDVPRGVYFLVLDHGMAAGRTAPGRLEADQRAALVSYAVRVVDP